MVDGEEFHNTSNIDDRGVGPVDMSFFKQIILYFSM